MSKGKRDRTGAKKIVERQRAAERRRTVTLWTSLSVVVVLLVAGMIGWVALSSQDNSGTLTNPPGTIDSNTAFGYGSGPVTVDVYEDFMCPICGSFEEESGAALEQMAAANQITIRYHPIAILDHYSNGTQYSTRSAGAVAAAAAAGKFREYHDALFANQPAEKTNGLDNNELIALGTDIGITDSAFADAIREKTYWKWATEVTETASSRAVTGTPTVLVDGKRVTETDGSPPKPATLQTAIAAAAG